MNGISRLIVRSVLRKDVGTLLGRLSPDAVVCTHPLPACLIAEMKRKGLRVPLCTVLTDFDIHGYWTHPGVDLYCVPNQEMAAALRDRVKGQSEVRVTGIPIARSFGTEIPNLKRIGNSSTKRILIMGGGLGIGVLPMVQQIVQSDGKDEITVVCGKNQALRRELQEEYGDLSNVTILGYMRQVSRLMSTSDLLVTKPGGLTVSEALAMKLPMVLYTPIPGHEWRNGQLMSKLGVAVAARTEIVAARMFGIYWRTNRLENG
ncbi:MGDG synthase family glycosyltransferase [Effusibacillus consociatus]|uniref:Glycosyltransferase n=1 Tax=Effusibacillus consociatus TaxID=1117041 RepID=A0ABV9Q1Y8_9BACL